MPITLDVTEEFSKDLNIGEKLTLRDKEGFIIAVLTIDDIFTPNLDNEAKLVYGTDDETHPAVNYLKNTSNPIYIGGDVKAVQLPHHYDYKDLRHTPDQLKNFFNEKGWDKIVAFQTRNPLHRAHVEMTMKSMENLNANILIHPVVGMTKPGDVNHYTRVRCYKHVMKKYPSNRAWTQRISILTC